MKIILPTTNGIIPHTLTEYNLPLKVYIDDIINTFITITKPLKENITKETQLKHNLLKNHIDFNFKITLNEFLSTDNEIFLVFKDKKLYNNKRKLLSKQGIIKIDNNLYKEILEVLQPRYFEDFYTAEVEGKKIISVKQIKENEDKTEFNFIIDNNINIETVNLDKLLSFEFVSLDFILDLVEQNKRLVVEKSKEIRNLDFMCKCCKNEYLQHLVHTKEMLSKTYIMEHNIKQCINILCHK